VDARSIRGLAMRQLLLATCVCIGVVGCSTPSGPPLDTLQQIEGEIIRFDADGYVIRDGYGKELRVHATSSARVDGNLSAGDRVRVHVAAPYQPNIRYGQAVYHFSDIATVYGELEAKNRSSIRVKDAAGGEVDLSLDQHSVGYGQPQPGDRIFVKTYRAPYEGEVQEFDDGGYTVRDISGREVRYERSDNPERPDSGKRPRAIERPVLRHDRPYARAIYLLTDPLALQGTLLRREDGLYTVTGSEELALILGQATLRDSQEQPGEKVFVVLSPLPIIQASSIEKL
jgi:hypothetical protein